MKIIKIEILKQDAHQLLKINNRWLFHFKPYKFLSILNGDIEIEAIISFSRYEVFPFRIDNNLLWIENEAIPILHYKFLVPTLFQAIMKLLLPENQISDMKIFISTNGKLYSPEKNRSFFMQTLQKEPVPSERHGHWIIHTNHFSPYQQCSICNFEIPLVTNRTKQSVFRYCPKCGVKMEEDFL